MNLDPKAILDQLVSHAMRLGLFERVNGHEPKSAPGHGLTAAVWLDRLGPLPEFSGLDSTSALVTFQLRVYTSMTAEPMDAIDPNVLTAVSTLMGAYSGDFGLGGTVSYVDLLAAHSPGMVAQAGYVKIDNKLMRVMTITLPMVVADVWEQAA